MKLLSELHHDVGWLKHAVADVKEKFARRFDLLMVKQDINDLLVDDRKEEYPEEEYPEEEKPDSVYDDSWETCKICGRTVPWTHESGTGENLCSQCKEEV